MDIEVISSNDLEFTLDDILSGRVELEYEIISEDEIDPTSNLDFDPSSDGFSCYGTYKENGGYRDFWTEKDWDFVYHLMMVKVARKFKAKQMIILDDYRDFRYLPRDWAENFCNELIKRGYKHMIDFKVYHNDTPRD